MYSVLLRDRNNNLVAKIDNLESLSYTRRFNQANEIVITLPRDDDKISYCQQAYYVEVYRNNTKKIAGRISKRNFEKNPIQITALSHEVLLSDMIVPHSWSYDGWEVANALRDLALKIKSYVKQTKEDWEDVNGERYQVDTTTQPTRYGDVILAKDGTGAYYPNGYVITAPIDLGSDVFKIDRIRYGCTTGELVRITIQVKVGNTIDELNADTWSSEFSCITDEDAEKKGVDFSLTNKPTKRYIKIKINLYTDDTVTPNKEGTVFGFTPILHTCEVVARYQTEIDTSLIPASFNFTLKGAEFSYSNHLEVFNSLCEQAKLTWYIDADKKIRVKKETISDYLGNDYSNKVVLKHGKEIEITQLSDEDTELCNALICLGAGDGAKQLRTVVKDDTSITLYGEHWGTFEDPQITNLTDLITIGQAELDKRKNPQQRFEINILKYEDEWGEIDLGDKVRVVSGLLNVNTTGRILEERRNYTKGQEIIIVGINSELFNLIDNITGKAKGVFYNITTTPPQDLKIIPGHRFIELRWIGNADYYIIEHSTDGINYFLLEDKYTGLSYRHLNLEFNSHHWYKIYSVKNGIKSNPAGPVDAYAKDDEAPATPTGLSVISSIRGITVTLNANTEIDWDGFEIHVSTTSGFTPDDTTLKARGKNTRFDIIDLEPGNTYYIKALAYDLSNNKSAPTPEVSIVAGKTETKDIGDEAITFQSLSTDTQLIYLATCFEHDTNNDEVPDGFTKTTAEGGNVVLTTEDQWRGAKSCKYTLPGSSLEEYASLICNKFIPYAYTDFPLIVRVIAKRTAGNGSLMLYVGKYDENYNLLSESNWFFFSSMSSNWEDYYWSLGVANLSISSNVRFLKLGLTVTYPGGVTTPSATTIYIDSLEIYPLQLLSSDIPVDNPAYLTKINVPMRTILSDATQKSATSNPDNYVLVGTYTFDIPKYLRIRKLNWKLSFSDTSSSTIYTYLVVYTNELRGRELVETYGEQTSTYSVLASPNSWYSFSHTFSADQYQKLSSFLKVKVEVYVKTIYAYTLYTKDIIIEGAAWDYAI